MMIRIPCTIVALALVGAAHAGAGPVPVRQYILEQQWEVRDDTTSFVLGSIEDVVVDSAGCTYVLDTRAVAVLVFSRTGEFLRTIGREGDGPGELRAPGSLFLADGNLLGVVSKRLGRVEYLDRTDGAPRASARLESLGSVVASAGQAHWLPGGNALVALVAEADGVVFPDWTWRLLTFDDPVTDDTLVPAGVVAQVGRCAGIAAEREEYFALWSPWTILGDGTIVFAPDWRTPVLEFRDRNGKRMGGLELPIPAINRTEEQRRRFVDLLCGGVDPSDLGVQVELEQHEPRIRSVASRADDELWIRTGASGHGIAAGVIRRYLVCRRDGSDLHYGELRGAGDDFVDRICFGPGDLVVIVHGAEGYIADHHGRSPTESGSPPRIVGYRMRAPQTSEPAHGPQD